MKNRLFFTFCLFSLFSSSYAEQFKMGDKLIKAKISYQHLNRISVTGDKIDSLVGLDRAFYFEKNERTGEVFIRPTEDNGHNDISLSITTVSGKTQDLLLEVVDGEASSIELVGDTEREPLLEMEGLSESNGGDYEESISEVMKKFINKKTGLRKLHIKEKDREHKHLVAKFKEAYNVDGFLCLEYEVSTIKEGIYRLDERMFSKKGDIALSLSSLRIKEDTKAILYVIRR